MDINKKIKAGNELLEIKNFIIDNYPISEEEFTNYSRADIDDLIEDDFSQFTKYKRWKDYTNIFIGYLVENFDNYDYLVVRFINNIIEDNLENSWSILERPIILNYIKSKKYDSFFTYEGDVQNIAVFDPNQFKSVFNRGTFSTTSDNIMENTNSNNKINESDIDFPKQSLPLDIWNYNQTTGEYTIKSELKNIIFDVISSFPHEQLFDVAEGMFVIGSSASNQWQDDSDIDVHVHVNNSLYGNVQNLQDMVWQWQNNNPEVLFNNHPIQLFVQPDPQVDFMNGTAYDLINDYWYVGPKIKPMDYNPYDDYSFILDDVNDLAGEADLKFGEIRRDAIDVETIKDAIADMPKEYQTRLLEHLKAKVEELVDDINDTVKLKKKWSDIRHQSNTSPELFKAGNGIFKYLAKYKYLDIINFLEDILADNKLSDEELDAMGSIL